MKTKWEKNLLVGLVVLVVIFVTPIAWFALGDEGYYYAGRCFCGNGLYRRMNTSDPNAARLERVWNVWAVWINNIPNNNYPKAQRISCINNLKQIGLAFRIWAGDNNDRFPFNVSTNAGGSMELCLLGTDGFDLNGAIHFQVMSNELNSPKILVCPDDKTKKPMLVFGGNLQAANVSYRIRSGTNITDASPRQVLCVCPVDGNFVYTDGEVMTAKGNPENSAGALNVR